MVYVDFCKSPKGYWVGCGEYNNGRVFASGRTIDILVEHIKTMAYKTWKMSARNVILSSRQMETGEFEEKHKRFMSVRFIGKFWNAFTKKELVKARVETHQKEKTSVKVAKNVISKPENKTGYTYEEKDGILYVYETKLIAQYKLYGGENEKQKNGD